MANEDWDEAVRRIEEAVTSGRKSLTISDLRITEIPPEISLLRRAEGKWSSFLAVPDMSLVEDVSEIGPDVGLRHINLSSTDVESLLPIESFENLRTVGIDSTQIEDLRPLLSLPKLVSPMSGKRRNGGRGVWFKETPACKDPHIARASEIEDDEERLQALLAHLRSLPPWPEEATQARQDRSTKDKAPRIFKKLTTRSAREMLETNHPLIRDRCQAVVAELDRGLAYHRIHIPNDDQALADHRQVEKALTYGKGMMESVHDAVPEDFTDRPLSEEEVSRFRDALNGAVDQLQAASRYIDRPDHTPTYGGLLKLGCATAVGSVFALMPGVAIAYAIPGVFSMLYGKDAVMKALASGK